VCHGVPQFISDVIDMPIGKDRYIREKQAVRKEENGGRPAVTRYEVVETFAEPAAAAEADGAAPKFELLESEYAHDRKTPLPPGRFALLKLSPKTGRTHQLRVHMAVIGHPLVADTMYGGRIFKHGDFILNRQALHAYEITFVHPATLETMTLKAPLPPDLEQLLSILRVKDV
jgi:23S rRNA-/tRNA-specific pseudouridylate synthase